jgi:hypothetical protein
MTVSALTSYRTSALMQISTESVLDGTRKTKIRFRNKNIVDSNSQQARRHWNNTCLLLSEDTPTAAVAYCDEEGNSAVGAHVTS